MCSRVSFAQLVFNIGNDAIEAILPDLRWTVNDLLDKTIPKLSSGCVLKAVPARVGVVNGQYQAVAAPY